MSTLQLRLKNCIQTILELEDDIHENGTHIFDDEFSTLKDYLGDIDNMELLEEEVSRMENVTSLFLKELELARHGLKPCGRILQ